AKAALVKLGVMPAPAAPDASTAGAPSPDQARESAKAILRLTRGRFQELPETLPILMRVLVNVGNVLSSLFWSFLVSLAAAYLARVMRPLSPAALAFFIVKPWRGRKPYRAERARRAELNAAADAAEQRLGFPISAAGNIPRTPEEDAQAKREFEELAKSIQSG